MPAPSLQFPPPAPRKHHCPKASRCRGGGFQHSLPPQARETWWILRKGRATVSRFPVAPYFFDRASLHLSGSGGKRRAPSSSLPWRQAVLDGPHLWIKESRRGRAERKSG